MISLIQGQVVTQYHWMTMQEFTDVVAISQMTPGPIGINTATYCGYTAVHNAGMSGMMAVLGSAMATFALVLPSLILMIMISRMLYKYMKTQCRAEHLHRSSPSHCWSGRSCSPAPDESQRTFLLPTIPGISTSPSPSSSPTFIGVKVMKINPIRM